MYARLWRPIDDPPGAANYLAQWKYAEADVLFESLDRAAQPLQDALHSIRANADLLLHSNDPVPTRPLDYVVNHVSIPHELNTFDTARGIKLPLTDVDVAQLQSLSEASALGVEGRGTVYDPTLRKSREIRADNDGPLRLSETLRSFDFPEARLRIQQALCATAVEVEYRPYKLVLYAPGDFFAAHGDMMSDASMFGSLALQIPITVGEGSIDEVGGALVFHPRTAHEASADLTTVLPTEPDGAVRLSYAAWLGDVQHEVREVKRARIVLLYRLFKRGHVPPCPPLSASSRVQLSLDAIFDCSEPNHLPVTATLPVFIYDCEDGEMPNPAPPGVFELDPTTYRSIISETTFPISCVGFMLQHHYPPAGLTPTELKGADAVLYEAVSATYTCHLVSVLEPRYKPYDDRYAGYFKHQDAEEARLASQIVKPVVVATSMEHWTTTQELNNHPIVLAAWVPGCGTLKKEGGGNMLGNWDCNTEWWYRSAALIVLPNRWSRCRWFYLAVLKGDAPGLQRLYAVQDVFQHVLRYVS